MATPRGCILFVSLCSLVELVSGSCQVSQSMSCPSWLCANILDWTTDVSLYCTWPGEKMVLATMAKREKKVVKISSSTLIHPGMPALQLRGMVDTTGTMGRLPDTCTKSSFAPEADGNKIYSNIKALVEEFDIYTKCTKVYVPRKNPVTGRPMMQKDDIVAISTELAFGHFSLSYEDIAQYKEYVDKDGTKTLVAIISGRKENVIEGNYDVVVRLFKNNTVKLDYTKRQNLAESVLEAGISFENYKKATQASVDRTMDKIATAGLYGKAALADKTGCFKRHSCTGYLTKEVNEKCTDDEQCKSNACKYGKCGAGISYANQTNNCNLGKCPQWLCSGILSLTVDVTLSCTFPDEKVVFATLAAQEKKVVKLSSSALIFPDMQGGLDIKELKEGASGEMLAKKAVSELLVKHTDTCKGTAFKPEKDGRKIYDNIKSLVDGFDIYSKCTKVYVGRNDPVTGRAKMQKDDIVAISTELAFGHFSLSYEDVTQYKEFVDKDGTKTLVAIISGRKENVIEGNYDIVLKLFKNNTVLLDYTKRQNLAEGILEYGTSHNGYRISTQASVDKTIEKLAYAGLYGLDALHDTKGCMKREFCSGYLTKAPGDPCTDDEQCKTNYCKKDNFLCPVNCNYHCAAHPDDKPSRKYTLLWYVQADGDMEGRLVKSVNELMAAFFNKDLAGSAQGGDPKDFAVNILIDRIPGFSGNPITGVGNFVTAKSFVVGKSKAEDVHEWKEVDMDRPATLERFIKQGMSRYPAQNYMMLMSGRGGGSQRGFGGDGVRGLLPGLGLQISDLVTGLSKGLEWRKFQLLGLDAGIMQHLGVARAVAPYTHHYLASQEIVHANGFNFNALTEVFKNPASHTVSQISTKMANAYMTGAPSELEKGLTMADVNTAKLKEFGVKFDDLVDALRCDLAFEPEKALVGLGRARSQEIFTAGMKAPGAGGESATIDLGTMLDHIAYGYAYAKGEEACVTKWGYECQFPFKYKGIEYKSCTSDQHTSLWCSTKVSEGREHVRGFFNWGNCADVCVKGEVDPKKYFSAETIARAKLAKTAYLSSFYLRLLSPDMQNEKASGMAAYWPAACDMNILNFVKAKKLSPKFADLLASIDHTTSCTWKSGLLKGKPQPRLFPKPEQAVCPGKLARPCVAVITGFACVFPFKYKGKQYQSCSGIDETKPWCSHKVDSNGEHVSGRWGYCAASCVFNCNAKVTDCLTCDITNAMKCTKCSDSKYLHNTACVTSCPKGFTGGDSGSSTGRTCVKKARLLATATSLSLSGLQAQALDTTLGGGRNVSSFMLNATVNAAGALTHASAMLGKSSDGKTIVWLVKQEAWFQDDALIFASVRDASIKFTQYQDGTPGNCDKKVSVFCHYKPVYSTKCPSGLPSCKPDGIACQVPVHYLPKGESQSQNGTLSVYIDYNTSNAASQTLVADGVSVPKSSGGKVTPILWETPVSVTDFEDEKKTKVLKQFPFDWARMIEIELSPTTQGTTYLALLSTDKDANQAHVMRTAPVHKSNKDPVWNPTCGSDKNRVKILGAISFSVSGLQKAQVEAAAKDAISSSLDVNAALIVVSATETRRLGEASERRLAGTWAVSFEVHVAQTKAAAVEQAVVMISKAPSTFREQLASSLTREASKTGIVLDAKSITVKEFTVSAGLPSPATPKNPTKPTGSSSKSSTAAPGAREGVVVGAATSHFFSSAVGLLVAAIGSI